MDKQLLFLGILSEGVIQILNADKNTDSYLYFRELGDSVVLLKSYIYHTKRKILKHLFDAKFDYKKTEGSRVEVKYNLLYSKNESISVRERNLANIEVMYMNVFSHMHKLQKDKHTIVKHSENISNINEGESSSRAPIDKKMNRQSVLIDGILVKYVNDKSQILGAFKKQFNRHTESWTVRGHYRRHKSGKEVFVRSYKKGSKKDFKAKDYEVKCD